MTLREKVALYEAVLHRISMLNTAMNGDGIRDMVRRIDSWSYAHRCGNGALTDREQAEAIASAAKQLMP